MQLMLDELASHERCLGGALINIVEKGRQQGLWLLGAGQHFGALSSELQSLLTGSTGLQAYFRLNGADARKVAGWLTEGTGTRVKRVGISSGKGSVPDYVTQRVPVQFEDATPVQMDDETYAQMAALTGTARADAYRVWAGKRRLYARLGKDRAWELGRFLGGPWHADILLESVRPLVFSLRFLRPKIDIELQETESQRAAALAGTISNLSRQEAVVHAPKRTALLKVAPMPDPKSLPDMATVGWGQTPDEVAATYQERTEEIERVAAQKPAPPPRPRTKPDSRRAIANNKPAEMPDIPEADDDGNL